LNSPTKKTAAASSADLERRGLLLVLSSPSGAGKTTLARGLLEGDPNLSLSISVTTRPARPGEVDGEDYIFLTPEQFDAQRRAGLLLEWAKVFGNHYGTPKGPVDEMVNAGRDVLFDIDWQGCQQLEEKMAADLVRVFVLPPSAKILEQRLRDRNQDADEVVARRMHDAAAEISHWAEYDYVIVNTDLTESLASLKSILTAERLKRERLRGLSTFVRDLTSEL
jgi:guanylate kinase